MRPNVQWSPRLARLRPGSELDLEGYGQQPEEEDTKGTKVYLGLEKENKRMKQRIAGKRRNETRRTQKDWRPEQGTVRQR
jgi:hypothetical protein